MQREEEQASRVEWYSTLWRFSKTGTMLPIRYICMSTIPKNRLNWLGKVLIFKTRQGKGLKKIFFPKYLRTPSFYFKEQSPKRKYENQIVWNFLLGPQDGQFGFIRPNQRKNIFLSFSLFLALKNQKRHSSQAQTPKTLQFLVFAYFWVIVKKILRPCCAKLKSSISKWNFGIGFL